MEEGRGLKFRNSRTTQPTTRMSEEKDRSKKTSQERDVLKEGRSAEGHGISPSVVCNCNSGVPDVTCCEEEHQRQYNRAETSSTTKQLGRSQAWTDADDRLLKRLIIDEKQYDWKVLARKINHEEEDVVARWQNHIYPKLRVSNKVGGALKWSAAEDCILLGFQQKYGFEFEQALKFLPVRTPYSMEGRWRRINRGDYPSNGLTYTVEEESPKEEVQQNKHQLRKQAIRQIALMKQP